MTKLQAGLEKSRIQTLAGQHWSAIRLVPLIRAEPRYDLRLYQQQFPPNEWAVVDLNPRLQYSCFSPHGMIVDWESDGTPVVSAGAQLGKADGKVWKGLPVRQLKRLVKKQKDGRVRLLSLDLAIAGFLATYFKAPETLWPEFYSKKIESKGLSPRSMWAYSGAALWGLEQALRTFEKHPQQVGMMLFVADAPAAVVLYPNPADYARVHRGLLSDMFSQTLVDYALYHSEVQDHMAAAPLQAQSWAELRQAVQQMRSELHDFQFWMGETLLQTPLRSEVVRKMGPFTLQRFISAPEADQAFAGECIEDQGALLYLKLMILPQEQQAQLELLDLLQAHDWNPNAAAQARQWSETRLIQRLFKAGLGDMVRLDRLRQALAQQK